LPAISIPICPPLSPGSLPDIRPYCTLPALVRQRLAFSVSIYFFFPRGEERIWTWLIFIFSLSCLDRLSDVTAIWNTNAFFAYIITVRLFKLKWELRKLLAVLVATFGVLAVVYGDAALQPPDAPPADHRDEAIVVETAKPKAPLVGDLLTLCASVGYGLYQVMYKRHAALPSDPEFDTSAGAYVPLPGSSDGIPVSGISEDDLKIDDLVYPPPFGLHPNLLACGIGLMTFLTLWIMLPVLHYTGYEPFRLPDSPMTILSITGIAGSGFVFNAGLMVTNFLCAVLYSS